MLWTIAVSEKKDFVCVHLFSWEILIAVWTVDEMNAVLQKAWKFVKISWNIVAVSWINFVEPYNPDEIEIFIATQNDPKIKQELQKIKEERDEKNLKTNGAWHLREIYEARKK